MSVHSNHTYKHPFQRY